jgi:hypothetical protein
VEGAALGHAIGESVRTQQDFNDCMLTSGWRIADQPPAAAPQDPRIVQLKSIVSQTKTCVGTAREKPIYAPLQPHLISLETEQFTMAQMADDHIPSQAESQLIVAYHDELIPCYNKYAAAASQVHPAIGPILAQERSDTEAVQLLLIKRQLTWGEAAQRERQIVDAAKAKLRAIRL